MSKAVRWVASLSVVLGACSSGPGEAEGEEVEPLAIAENASELPVDTSGGGSCTAAPRTCSEPDGTSSYHKGCSISCPTGSAPTCLDADCGSFGGGFDGICKCLSSSGTTTPTRSRGGIGTKLPAGSLEPVTTSGGTRVPTKGRFSPTVSGTVQRAPTTTTRSAPRTTQQTPKVTQQTPKATHQASKAAQHAPKATQQTPKATQQAPQATRHPAKQRATTKRAADTGAESLPRPR